MISETVACNIYRKITKCITICLLILLGILMRAAKYVNVFFTDFFLEKKSDGQNDTCAGPAKMRETNSLPLGALR